MKTKKQPSQKVLVLKHLLRYDSITAATARDKYGVDRLAARIRELREDLYYRSQWRLRIVSGRVDFKTRLGRHGTFVRYSLAGDPREWREAFKQELEGK